jgi:zinc/manganese transport system substrate-binding protein
MTLKKIFTILWTAVLLIGASFPVFAAPKKLNVVATLPDLASLAKAVGGEHVNVSSLALGMQDPHFLEAKPSYEITLSKADLLIYNGLSLEVGWLPLLVQDSRNPNILSGAKGSLNASSALDRILEKPTGEVDRSMGDIHPEGNPHYLVDPRNGLKIARLIRDKLSALDPSGAADYQKNYAQFESLMTEKLKQWESQAAPLKGMRVIVYHKQWEYLADWLGLEIAGSVEEKPGIPAGPQHKQWLIDEMKKDNIKVLLVANYNPSISVAERLAKETGSTLLVLPASTGGEPGIDSYPQLFDYLVSKLAQAQGAGK